MNESGAALSEPENKPLVPWGFWLKNGNPAFDLRSAPRCHAKTRSGGKCKVPSMLNGRCRFHGGKSTGPRTPEGLAKSQKANWKNGRYSSGCRQWRRNLYQLQKATAEMQQSAHAFIQIVRDLEQLVLVRRIIG